VKLLMTADAVGGVLTYALELVSGLLRHNVHDAHHYGVVLDDTGKPTEASLAALAGSPETKVITINVEPL